MGKANHYVPAKEATVNKNKITFEAVLKQTTPVAKPIKFGPDGDSEIIFEADASQQEAIKQLIGQSGVVFKITMEVA